MEDDGIADERLRLKGGRRGTEARGRSATNFRFRRITPLVRHELWHVWVRPGRGRGAGVRHRVVELLGREASNGTVLEGRVEGDVVEVGGSSGGIYGKSLGFTDILRCPLFWALAGSNAVFSLFWRYVEGKRRTRSDEKG